MRVMLNGFKAGLWTALPGIIQSFNQVAMTVTVQPAIQGTVTNPDGTTRNVNLPLLPDVPVCYPRGGGCTLTFPIAKGDECLMVFSARCIDSWWQSGGVQVPYEPRMMDLSDGFALPGPFSQSAVISGVSTTSVQLRSNDASTYFDLNPTTQKIKIVAPGGFEVDAPTNLFTGAVTIQGLLTWLAGMAGSTTSGIAATVTGIINFVGSITSNGKAIDSTHTHHENGAGSNTNPPN